MKKDILLNMLFWKAVKLKPTCEPYRFLQFIKFQDSEIPRPQLTVKDVLQNSPVDIRMFLEKWTMHTSDRRKIRVALKNAMKKLSELGLSEKDGLFMSGSYLPTMHSPKAEWIQYWISELGFKRKEAEKTYDLALKAELL